MKCDDVCKVLSAYADGEIEGRTASEARTHMEQCASCRAQLAGLDALQSRLEEMMSEPLESSDMSALVMASLPAGRRRVSAGWVWATAAAILVVVGLVWQASWRRIEPAKVPVVIARRTSQSPARKPIVAATREKIASRPASAARKYAMPPRQRRQGGTRLLVRNRPTRGPACYPIRVAAATVTTDGRVETTLEIRVGDVPISRVKKTEITIAPDESATSVERPPLEVVGNTGAAATELKPNGG
jgi:hypothetical protein